MKPVQFHQTMTWEQLPVPKHRRVCWTHENHPTENSSHLKALASALWLDMGAQQGTTLPSPDLPSMGAHTWNVVPTLHKQSWQRKETVNALPNHHPIVCIRGFDL